MTVPVFLLFGATGDLARRMLWPSLYHLFCDGLLPEGMRLVGTSRSALTPEAFRAQVREAIATFMSKELKDAGREDAFLARISYMSIDVGDPAAFCALADHIGADSDLTVYLSTSPSLYTSICAGLAGAGLAHDQARLVMEKPIGHDLASSQAISAAVSAAFPEERTYRIDHYLGKETVQNLLALRFANSLFEPVWNAQAIHNVQITVAETVGVEGRWSYYDGAGALRDMVQNHILQLLALVAMEPPTSFEPDAVRNEKIKVLRSLRPVTAATSVQDVVFGQYSGGVAGGAQAPGYLAEEGAFAGSRTETFVALCAHVDNWRWKGVPFFLRTGKRLDIRRTEIVVQFRDVPHNIFAADAVLKPNRLVIRLQPEETVTLELMNKQPGLNGIDLRPLALNLSLTEAFGQYRRRIAYERLLLDAFKANSTLFVRRDELEAAWRWIDGIHAAWAQQGGAPKPYAAGSWGPVAAASLVERRGVSWHD